MSAVREPMADALDRPEFGVDEFSYRPVPPLVAVSVAFIFISVLAMLWDLLLVVPLVGALIAFIAYRQVKKSAGNLSGGGTALFSMGTMLVMFAAFLTMHIHVYATEVPDGYQRVNFTTDISLKGFETVDGRIGIHPDVKSLEGKPIYLKGYMYPFRETHGLKSFVLCKDSGECCFGGQPKPTDMILVNMVGRNRVDYQDKRLVGVAGKLRIQPTYAEGDLKPVYQLDCDYFAPAKTWY